MWRFLLTCLLLVALPLKGYAATSMLACGPDHHSIDAAAAQADLPPPSHDHGAGAPHHPMHGSHDGHASPAAEPAPAAGQAADQSAQSKCGTCAPCCIGAALIGDLSIHIAPPAGSADFPAFTTGHCSPPLGRLDRPPRTIAA